MTRYLEVDLIQMDNYVVVQTTLNNTHTYILLYKMIQVIIVLEFMWVNAHLQINLVLIVSQIQEFLSVKHY